MENEISFREIREGINPTESENARMWGRYFVKTVLRADKLLDQLKVINIPIFHNSVSWSQLWPSTNWHSKPSRSLKRTAENARMWGRYFVKTVIRADKLLDQLKVINISISHNSVSWSQSWPYTTWHSKPSRSLKRTGRVMEYNKNSFYDNTASWWTILPTFGEPVFILREISL
jgi:hypothetical protein